MNKKYEIDMCNGPLFSKILLFTIPLILSGILQLLFNAADIVVVGRFSGNEALAAVGATSSLITLLINLFMGISVGANVAAARFYGSRREKDMQETVHTAISMALLIGISMVVIGQIMAKPMLQLMDTPDNVIDQSVLYIRLYFLGMPMFMLYNFGAAILRAVGDTRRPLYFLLFSGVVNVVLNLILVIVVRLGVAGVAIATATSQCISGILVIRCLMKSEGVYHLDLKSLRFYGDKVSLMLKIGIPAGLQSLVFNISNIMIQSSVNSFGSVAVAGNTAASNIEGFIYTSMNAVHQSTVSFTGQNLGAGKFDRVRRMLVQCLFLSAFIGITMGQAAYRAGSVLLRIYTEDPEVVAFGLKRLGVIAATYALCGVMEVFSGTLRGMGRAIVPMLSSLAGSCLFRIIWIFTVFRADHDLHVLYLSYPISWTITILLHLIYYLYTSRRIRNRIIDGPRAL